ncbi:MAG: hypothetical protein QOG99_2330, partial [Frankiales bacterium]|nr:hypothetical protein [Frankiales bacterium]
MTEEQTPPPAGEPTVNLMADLTADPMVLGSGLLVGLGLLLLIVGVAGNWHWRAAIWGAVVSSVAAFGLVAYSANQRRAEFPAEVDEDAPELPPPPSPPEAVKAAAATEPPPPRPRFVGFGKSKTTESVPPAVKPPPPQPSNVQVMHVQGSNVRVAPTPQPMPISRPERPASRPPSAPPATPPT